MTGRTITLLSVLLALASLAAPVASGSGKGRGGSPDDSPTGEGRRSSPDDGILVPDRGLLRVLAETSGGRAVVEVRLEFASELGGDPLADEIVRRFALSEQEAAAHLVVAGGTALEDSDRLRIRVDRGRCEIELRFRLATTDRRSIAPAIAERTRLRRDEALAAVRGGEFRRGGGGDDAVDGVKRRGDGSVDDSQPGR